MSFLTEKELMEKIAAYPKVDLIHLPTPIKKLEALSSFLGGPEIYIKRDDLTGLAFGGNKSRKLEYIIQDALAKKVDVIITWAGLQSNWCLQTAAAARKFQIKPILLLFKTYDLPEEYDGNLLLDYILEADIRIKAAEKGKLVTEEFAMRMIDEVANEMRESGHNPYIAPIGGSMVGGSMEFPLGAISYVRAYAETHRQARDLGVRINYVVHATGSGGTQAGLVVGSKALDPEARVLGITVSDEKEPFSRIVHTITIDTQKALGLDLGIGREDIIVLDEYLKDGYGVLNKEVADVVRLVFTTEGIILDPVYTGKAMAGLVDLIKKGTFKKEDKVVFFHTGGTPALFPNKHNFLRLLG